MTRAPRDPVLSPRASALGVAFALAASLASFGQSTAVAVPCEPVRSSAQWSSLTDLSFGFVPNQGQWDTDAQFVASSGKVAVRADSGGWWFEGFAGTGSAGAPSRAVFRFDFATASELVVPRPEQARPGTRNYFQGRDPEKWQTGLTAYSRLVWPDVSPGVDFALERAQRPSSSEIPSRLLQYSLHCAPKTGERPLALRLRGADRLWIDADGSLVASTSIGELRQSSPRAWEFEPSGARRELMARFALVADERFAIDVPGRDDTLPLIIDPGLDWAGYIGGTVADVANDMALTTADEPVVVGWTSSWDFPTTLGVIQPIDPPGVDGFVMKVAADGASVKFATYLGGSELDEGWGVAIRPSGSVIVGGMTRSADFPVTPGALDTQLSGEDGIVFELRPDGSGLLFSTYLGGSTPVSPHIDRIRAITLRGDGAIVVAGDTNATDFPGVATGMQPLFGGGATDTYVAVIAPNGSSILSATYLGGVGDDRANAIALRADGAPVVGGNSKGGGFPVTPGAYDRTYTPFSPFTLSGFVAQLDRDLSTLGFATYLDGSFGSLLWNVAVDPSNNVVVGGTTSSTDFPLTGDAPFSSHNGSSNGFTSVLSPDGSSLKYSTLHGSPADGGARALSVDESGVITIGGGSHGDTFPTTPGAFDTTVGTLANPDAYLMRFKPDGSALLYSTLMGKPAGWEETFDIEIDSKGRAILFGNVLSDSFPTTPGSFDPTYGGGPLGGYDEGFLARLEMQPLGVTSYGTTTPACAGPIRLTALGEPKAGNPTFAIACVGAPPGAIGVLGIGAAGLDPGLAIVGIALHVDVAQPHLVLAAGADADGYEEVAAALPAGAVGITLYSQAIWVDTGGCTGAMTLSASDALRIEVSAP